MRYIEKTTNGGFFLRVNPIEGNYSAYMDNKPVINTIAKRVTSLYDLQRVIFIGSIFKQNSKDTGIGFFYVSKKQIVIPFRVTDSSDIRHLRLPTSLAIDILPVSVSHFNDINIGYYANALKSGMQYFILEPRFGRNAIMTLKQTFPRSRVIIYCDDKNLFNSTKEEKEGNLYEEEKEMDFELIEKEEIALLSKDVLFSARVFILKKQWYSLSHLPFKLPISGAEAKLISFYLKTEITLRENLRDENGESFFELEKIKKLYETLEHFLSMKKKEVDRHLSENFMDTELIFQLERVITAKRKHLDSTLEDDRDECSFYDYAILKLKERKIKIEESYP